MQSSGGKTSDQRISELAEDLEANKPLNIDMQEFHKEIYKKTNGLLSCFSTVLLQEIEKYNRLLTKMTTTLSLLI